MRFKFADYHFFDPQSLKLNIYSRIVAVHLLSILPLRDCFFPTYHTAATTNAATTNVQHNALPQPRSRGCSRFNVQHKHSKHRTSQATRGQHSPGNYPDPGDHILRYLYLPPDRLVLLLPATQISYSCPAQQSECKQLALPVSSRWMCSSSCRRD